jgi:endoglucanase
MKTTLRTLCLMLLVLMAVLTCNGKTQDPQVQTEIVSLSPGLPQLRGANFPGGELDWGKSNVTNPVQNVDYLFVSHQDIDYLAGKGANFARLVFSWEGLQPTGLGTAFPTTGNSSIYVNTLMDRVNYATSKGMWVMIEPHGAESKNFARYKGNLVGSTAVPNSAFADLWTRLATQFKGNPHVVFGLSNEPNNMSTIQWFQAAQAAILGIRSTGATNLILVPGNGWTNASNWTLNWYDTASPQVSNATAYLQYIKDPANNTAFSVHLYFDTDAGGVTTGIVSPTIGVERLSPAVQWARANGVKLHVSEFGSDSSAAGHAVVINTLNYMDTNQDVVMGWSWWAMGPPLWWGSYQFTLDPSSTVDAPQMSWLKPYFVPAGPVDAGADTSVDAGHDAGTLDAGRDAATVDAGQDAGHDAGHDAGVVSAFHVTPDKTYDWTSGYCEEFLLKNVSTAPAVWKSMSINLYDAHLRGATSVWGATFPNPTATGLVTVTPNAGSARVPAGTMLNIGFCADRGPSGKTATLAGLH